MLECHTSFCGCARLSANCNTVIKNKSLHQMIKMRLYLKLSLQQGPKVQILKFNLTPVPMQLSWHGMEMVPIAFFWDVFSAEVSPSVLVTGNL